MGGSVRRSRSRHLVVDLTNEVIGARHTVECLADLLLERSCDLVRNFGLRDDRLPAASRQKPERKYHRQRAQDTLGVLTPIEFEAKLSEPLTLAA